MKKLRKITRHQRNILINNGYDSYQWLFERQTQEGITFVHKETHEKIVLKDEN